MHHSEDTAHYKLTYLDLTFKGHPRSKVMRSTKRPNMTYYMCFIYTLVITCIVSDILVQIDYKGPNLTFLTFKMTFRVTAHHLYFRTALTSLQ